MQQTLVRFSYDSTYLVPVKNLSKLLELLGECPKVNYEYLDDDTVYFIPSKQRPPELTILTVPVMSEAEFLTRKAEVAARVTEDSA